MKSKLLLSTMVVVMVVSLVIVGCAPKPAPPAAPPAEVYEARMAVHWPPTHHSCISSHAFAEEVRKATDGRLDITVYDSGKLYGAPDVVPATAAGSVELGGTYMTQIARYDPNLAMLAIPFFFKDFAQQRALFAETIQGKLVWDRFERTLGVTKLAHATPPGYNHIWMVKTPIRSLEDCKGVKIRMPAAAEAPTYKALAMSTIAVPTAEVYTALQTGMIRVMTTVPVATISYSWYEFLKYGIEPPISLIDGFFIANTEWWNTLPADLRDIVLTKVAPKVDRENLEILGASEAQAKKQFVEAGGEIYELAPAEVARFRELFESEAWPEMAKDFDPGFWKAAKKHVGL